MTELKTSPTQLRALRTFAARRKTAGWQQTTVWLDPKAVAGLKRLTLGGRTKQDVIRALLAAHE